MSDLATVLYTTTDYLLGRTDSINITANDKDQSGWNTKLTEFTSKDEKDIAKKLQDMIDELEGETSLAFDGKPMDDNTRELVLA